ncbi:hypothetical protein HB364_07680 [Pseudoflavitalea sp. X16]|uniref:gliding motility lipoprotein GldB n=1 Tax=Paraflavitalea devenefica TaxID=2716334 RepID=UPI00141D7D2A|nr:hypothetical protein [Paraflavitalea devenefica]NII24953.1 hypothetical protein [Paraflavitalea devenefica]
MKRTGFIALLLCTLLACRDKDTPDVSDIKVDLTTHRFDQDFFAVDTSRLMASLQQLAQKYPWFITDYSQGILGLPPFADTSTQAPQLVKQFLRDYQPIKKAVDETFASTRAAEAEIKKGLQFVKYYFPAYKTPPHLVFYIGPLDAYYETPTGLYGDAINPERWLGVGLQLHLGKDFSLYQSEMGRQLFPAYISRRFTPETIPVNCIKNIIDDIYPEKLAGKTLVEQMVEKGKRLYVLDKLMPETPDTLKIGYTDRQLKGCYANEGKIWNFFLVNSLLMNNDPSLIKGYMGEAPNTPELGEGSPGYIGLFTGWQIVKKYMEKNPDLKLPALLQKPAMDIYQQSKYKPK